MTNKDFIRFKQFITRYNPNTMRLQLYKPLDETDIFGTRYFIDNIHKSKYIDGDYVICKRSPLGNKPVKIHFKYIRKYSL